MSVLVKSVLVTLVALVATGLSLVSAHAGENVNLTAKPAPSTLLDVPASRHAAKSARAVYTRLRKKMRSQKARIGKAKSILTRKRLTRLPASLRAPMVPGSLRDRNRDGRIDSARITFRAGTAEQDACLNLRTGKVSDRACRAKPVRTRASLVGAYKRLVETAIWFDRNRAIYGHTAHDIALVRRVLIAEIPERFKVTYTDVDDDALVDDGVVTLTDTATGACGTVSLPARAGTDYSASMVSC